MTRRGGCLCGAVRYETEAALRDVVACHCGQCRRSSGHHVAATGAPREAVRIEGETLRWFESSPGHRRGFCGVCGSNLFWSRDASPFLAIFAGTLDAPTGLRLTGHIYVADKGDYYHLADGLPQAAGRDPSLTAGT